MQSPGRPEKVGKFKGKTGEECENFIHNIRDVAWTEGKLQDGPWMADFASLHYYGKALEWHSDLPLDVRQDWFKQERALLERWPPPADSDAETTIIPIPAAAPNKAAQLDKSIATVVLAFIPKNQTETLYVGNVDSDGDCRLSKDLTLALRFRWDREANPRSRILECWSDSVFRLLSVYWVSGEPSICTGSSSWARFTVLDPATLLLGASIRGRKRESFRIDVWDISPQGQVTPARSNSDGTTTPLNVFSRNNIGLFIAADRHVYQRSNPTEHHGHLMFKYLE